jgi:hypothetical protein
MSGCTAKAANGRLLRDGQERLVHRLIAPGTKSRRHTLHFHAPLGAP